MSRVLVPAQLEYFVKDHGTVSSGSVDIDTKDGMFHIITVGGDITINSPNWSIGNLDKITIVLKNAYDGFVDFHSDYNFSHTGHFQNDYVEISVYHFSSKIISFVEQYTGGGYVYLDSWNANALSEGDTFDSLTGPIAINGDGSRFVIKGTSGILSSAAIYTATDTTGFKKYSYNEKDLPGSHDNAGDGLAISNDGDELVVTNPEYDDAQTNQGIVYSYTWSSDWNTSSANLVAPTPTANERFGIDVDLSDNGLTLVIGAVGSGSVYIYDRTTTSGTWTQRTGGNAGKITVAGVSFGSSVAISENKNILAVGAETANSSAGAIYIYSWGGSSWTQDQIINFSYSTAEKVGYEISISGDGETIIATTQYEKNDLLIFKKRGSSWEHVHGFNTMKDSTSDLQYSTINYNGSSICIVDTQIKRVTQYKLI